MQREQDIDLLTCVSELLEILDQLQARLLVGDVDVQIVLLSILIDGNSLKGQVSGKDQSEAEQALEHT